MSLETQNCDTFIGFNYWWFRQNHFLTKFATSLRYGGKRYQDAMQLWLLKLFPGYPTGKKLESWRGTQTSADGTSRNGENTTSWGKKKVRLPLRRKQEFVVCTGEIYSGLIKLLLQGKGGRGGLRTSQANARTRTRQANAKDEDRTYERGRKTKARSSKWSCVAEC